MPDARPVGSHLIYPSLGSGNEHRCPEVEDAVRRPGFEPGSIAWNARDGGYINPKFLMEHGSNTHVCL